MRVLFVSNIYPTPAQPTRGSFNRNTLKAMSARHEVRALVPVPWSDELSSRLRKQSAIDRDRTDWVDGIRVEYPRFYYPPKIMRSHYGTFLWASVRKTVLRSLRDFAPEAIISYWTHPDGAVAVRAAQKAGVPSVVMVGGTDVLILTKQNASRRQAIVSVLKAADRVVCVSQHLADAVGDLGIKRSKIAVVYRGIDYDRFHPGDATYVRRRLGVADSERLLLSVGRLVPVKGFKTLLDAYEKLLAQRSDFKAVIAGCGPLRATLQAQIDNFGIGDRVSLLGNKTADELAELYRAADLSVLSSHSEGIPNVLLESIASGTPFVATDVGGVSEIADPTRDLLVPANDPVSMADAIDQHLNRWLRDGQLDCPPRVFEPWTWGHSAEELIQVAESAMGVRHEAWARS